MDNLNVNDAGEDTSVSVEDTLTQRGKRYGSFERHAELSQKLQNQVIDHIMDNNSLETSQDFDDFMPTYMTEAICMICHKLARIANGDPYYDDSWRDIAGYAQLVVDILNGKDKS